MACGARLCTVVGMTRAKIALACAAAALAALFAVLLLGAPHKAEPATFNELVAAAAAPDVSSADFDLAAGTATITLPGREVSGPAPRTWMEDTAAALAGKNITVDTNVITPSPWWQGLLTALLPMVLIIGGLAWLIKRQTGSIGAAGKSLTDAASRPTTRLDDVEGMPETVETMREIIDLWSADLTGTGVAPLKGALLVGPPGTGKTLLARAMAGETGCSILATNGSEFNEVFAGVGAKRVRKLFDNARKMAGKEGRVIVFIDEIDSIAASRSAKDMTTDSGQEHAQTLNAILHELDGFTPEERIFLIGATNQPDIIDPALVRPGRFDRVITVGLPDAAGRASILQLYVDKQNATSLPVADDFDVAAFAKRCPGASGAELADVVATAARMAYLAGADHISRATMSDALAEVAVGKARKSAMMSGDDLAVTAWHEAGHTVAALVQPHTPDPVEVTVVPRGAAGGITWLVERDSPYHTYEQLHADLVVAMAGRAGELMRPGGRPTTGASSDLAKATQIATGMVCAYGMRPDGQVGNLPERSDRVEVEVETILARAQADAHTLLDAHADLLAAVAAELLECETVDAERLTVLRARHDTALAA